MFKYTHPRDNFIGSGTATPSTEDSGYPIENLYDNRPTKPFRFEATTGNIVWDFTTARQFDGIVVCRHNLQDALPGVRIQANSGNVWTSPPFNRLLTVRAADLDGHTRNIADDFSAVALRSYRYWRFIVGSANDVAVSLGEMFLGAMRALPNSVDFPVSDTIEQPLIEHQTDFLGNLNYDLGVKRRNFNGTTKVTLSGRAVIQQYWDACHGRALPHFIIPFAEDGDNDAFMVKFTNMERADVRTFFNYVTIDLSWQEVSNGLRARD